MPPSYTDTHCCDDADPPSSPSRTLLYHDYGSSSPSRQGTLRCNRRPAKPEAPAGGDVDENLLVHAARELAAMRGRPPRSFPPACLHLHNSLPGNARCNDCRAPAAGWASVSHGTSLCLACAGRHRGLGVGTSVVRSLTLDGWTSREVLCMLEGGNDQLDRFFDNHGMGGGGAGRTGRLDRYRTKAASFYRQHLQGHARRLAEREELYEGREASRRKTKHHSAVMPASSSSKNNELGRRHAAEQLRPRPPRRAERVGQACVVAGA